MANIILKKFTKKFKDVKAVDDLNIEIKDKELAVLVGPSGYGKTTTLWAIAGLEEATEGEIYLGDRLVNDVQPKDRDIAIVFQNYALYPHMDVYNWSGGNHEHGASCIFIMNNDRFQQSGFPLDVLYINDQ